MSQSLIDPYPLTQLYVRFRITAYEAIRQAYEHFSYRVTKEKIEQETEEFKIFGNISPVVRKYADLLLNETIKP